MKDFDFDIVGGVAVTAFVVAAACWGGIIAWALAWVIAWAVMAVARGW